MSLSITRGGRMLYTPRLCVSLVSEAGIFWWTPSVPISGGRPWSRLCSAQVRIRLFLLLLQGCWSSLWVGPEGRYAVGPFWWEAVQGSSRSAIHLPSVSQSHYIGLQVTRGEAASAKSGFLWWHWPIGYVSSLFEEDSWGPGPSSRCGISAAPPFV